MKTFNVLFGLLAAGVAVNGLPSGDDKDKKGGNDAQELSESDMRHLRVTDDGTLRVIHEDGTILHERTVDNVLLAALRAGHDNADADKDKGEGEGEGEGKTEKRDGKKRTSLNPDSSNIIFNKRWVCSEVECDSPLGRPDPDCDIAGCGHCGTGNRCFVRGVFPFPGPRPPTPGSG